MASSSATMPLCSSLTAQCKISNPHQNPFPKTTISLPKPLLPSLPITHRLNSSSLLIPATVPALGPPKFSESEAPVLEAESESGPPPESDLEPPAAAQIVDITQDAPKREEVFAVVMIGSRQYIVIPGRFIYVQRLKGANVNDKVTLNKVLLVGTRTSTYIGKPVVTNAAVHAVVEEQGLDPKVIVFKYKKKKNYQRNIGHRQPNTRIRITGITGYQDYPAVTLES